MRPVWKGILSFGLVNVPVSLFNATRPKTINFNQLRKSDYSRIKYKKVAHDGTEVQQHEIVKDFEVGSDRYVVITESDMEAISPKASRIIEISDFVKLEDIDPRYYDSSYYLMPDQGANKAYMLLLQSMQEANVVGIAKFILRSKEYLAAIRPTEGILTLSTMLFADELVKPSDLEVYMPANINITEKELKMAKTLIDSLITKFEPEKYENGYYKQVMEMIDKKAEGAQITSKPSASAGNTIDLMAAIQASIKAIQEKKQKEKKPSKKQKPA